MTTDYNPVWQSTLGCLAKDDPEASLTKSEQAKKAFVTEKIITGIECCLNA